MSDKIQVEKVGVYRNGKVHVMARQCDTCIFRPGNLMNLEDGRVEQMVACAVHVEGTIPCHQTLKIYTGKRGKEAICRGFWDRHKSGLMQVAERMGVVRYQESAK